jgi:hypothetical protein
MKHSPWLLTKLSGRKARQPAFPTVWPHDPVHKVTLKCRDGQTSLMKQRPSDACKISHCTTISPPGLYWWTGPLNASNGTPRQNVSHSDNLSGKSSMAIVLNCCWSMSRIHCLPSPPLKVRGCGYVKMPQALANLFRKEVRMTIATSCINVSVR